MKELNYSLKDLFENRLINEFFPMFSSFYLVNFSRYLIDEGFSYESLISLSGEELKNLLLIYNFKFERGSIMNFQCITKDREFFFKVEKIDYLKSKSGKPYIKIVVNDKHNDYTLCIFTDKNDIQVGDTVCITGFFLYKNGVNSIVYNDIEVRKK